MPQQQQQPQKPKSTVDKASEGLEILKRVSRENAEAAKKNRPKNEPPPPDTLPENWGVGDLVRVGVSRFKRAVYGPPQPETKDKK